MGRPGSSLPYELERAEVFNRLVHGARVGLFDAEQRLRAWESKAEELGRQRTSEDFWAEGHRWILGEIALGRLATS